MGRKTRRQEKSFERTLRDALSIWEEHDRILLEENAAKGHFNPMYVLTSTAEELVGCNN